SDLQTAPSGDVYLDIVAPIRAPYSDARLGFLVQRIAPERYLFPLIQSWPGPSKTAETLLVRRDGNQLLYLNQLRHQSGTAMHLTRPVDDPDLPAAHAVLGQEDVFTGRDYRGKAVFAATRQIPHTPWAMVTKLDTEEVLAPLRRNNLHAFGWSLLLMVAGAAFTLYLLRQQRLLFNEQQAREKRAAEELARTQARLMEAQRIGRIGSWERDLATGEMWWSEEAYRLFGLDPETDTASLEGFLERVHPEDRERMQGSTEQHPEDGHPLTLEFRIILPNGEVRHCINHGRLFRDAAGQPVRIGGTTQDITERKLAEEEYRRQSAQLQAVLHNLPQGISVFDEKLRLQLWNEGLREVLDLPREALYRGAPFEDLVRYPAERGEYGPGDVEEKIQARKTLAMQFEPHRFERTHLNGRTTLIQGEPLFEDNRLAGFITTYTDITESKRVQETLEKQNTVLQSILDNIPDGISLFDANLGMVACNEQLKTLLDLPESLFARGLPNLKEVLEFNAARGEYGAEHPEQLVQEILQRASEPALHAFERTRPNGTVLHVRGVPLPNGGFVTVYTDVTQHRRAEERLLLAEKVFANSPEAIMICDQGNRIISVNQAFCDITGYAQDEVLGRDPRILASGRHDKEFYGRMWQTLRESGAWAGEIWDRRKNGEIYPKWMTINALHDTQSGALTHYITLFSDITERKETEARIHHLAHHDPLTGLPNRFTLEARLDQSLAHARRHGNKVAVMFLDLDRFKTINDSLGHAVGDALLMEIAHRLRTSVRESDTVARLGGDEFVVILPEVDSANDAAHVAAKIIEQIALPVQVAPHALHTSASVGISLYPDDGDAVAVVMQNADTAMYHAKAVGRNNFQFFAAAMNLAATERLELERKLRQAMAKQEFTLHYQPQFSVAADRITGVEALLRWNHP
ncbi:MAG: PAS-domain containing protein, partial [Betaproteobacteria bacterium]|nr:PAS-domain containing protein [Betaproteobacteria bacterium]